MNVNAIRSRSRQSACAMVLVTASAAAALFLASRAHAAVDTTPAAAGQSVVVAQNANCRNCGVVESVVAVRRPGQTQGIAGTPVTPGMAIGGVVGGLLGNQIGHGSGRAAATVVGAAGGAYAGHAIEQNRAQRTAYVMHIRMQDGSVRTIEQAAALRKGARVVVEGRTARLVRARHSKG
jgi:outer membrane lipoprotein SlyB